MKTVTRLSIVSALVLAITAAGASWYSSTNDNILASFQRDLNRVATTVSDIQTGTNEPDPLQLAINAVVWTPKQDQVLASFQRDLDRQATTVTGYSSTKDDRDPLPEMFRLALLDHPSRIGKALASVKVAD